MTALLTVSDLRKAYAGVHALDGVSFEVAAGSITGLIGPNGSGKSTAIDCLSGFQKLDGGRVSLEGTDITGKPAHLIARAGLMRTFQTVRIYERLSLRDNLAIANQQVDPATWVDEFFRTRRYRDAVEASEARAKQLVGLIGPNGSGKSTIVDCLSGFKPADGGQWRLDGRALTGLPAHRIARAGLTRTFQTVRAYDELTLLDNLRVAAQERDGVGWLPSLSRGPRLRAAEKASEARGRDLLATVGLAEYAEAPAAILSYGQRKLLAIAAAMMARPKLVVLDEPVAGVNPTMIRRIETVIHQLNAEGVTFVIVEHNVDFIMSLCRRVIVLEAGEKIADGPPHLIRSDPHVLAAYLGQRRAAELEQRHGSSLSPEGERAG